MTPFDTKDKTASARLFDDLMSAYDELSEWARGKRELRVTHVEVDDVDEDEEPAFYVLFQQGPLGWTAAVPDLPGCVASGKEQWEAEEGIMLAMARYRKALTEKGESLPAARAYSKKVHLASDADLEMFADGAATP